MKVTLITVCRNAATVIAGTLESVRLQTHPDIEHIVIDGASTDGTMEVLRGYAAEVGNCTLVSEPDKGIYDAMNKGLSRATGDLVGFINAGDMLMTPQVVAHVAEAFERSGADAVYGDIIMVDEADITKVHRTWISGSYRRENFRKGWMPPHVATFFRKQVYDRYGHFNLALRIGADYEIMLRFLYRHRISAVHLPEVLVRFRLGGMSNGSIRHILKANREVRASWGINGLNAPPLLVTRKLWSKVMQFFH
ncbi:MAG: glycosyltransferase [Flavobacteriales bacterium]|jgi:glycosyltransferase involved in cell wall biosynthesis|nr:glycosyltransferase [Flavobacteriales bacterium]